MPYIHSVKTALPPHYYDQETLIDRFRHFWEKKFHNFSRIESFHRHVLVGGRHLALPIEDYDPSKGFAFRNDAWIKVSLELLEQASLALLQEAQLVAQDISLMASTSVTGIAVPSLEARLMNRLPFRPQTKRMPLFGLGCMAGVGGINRVQDYLKGHPKEAALFLSSELCSLTIQFEDFSVANIVSTGLFGDGAAAVLMVGDEHPLAKQSSLKVVSVQSAFFPKTERVMGWDMNDEGFKIVLNSQVPQVVLDEFPSVLQNCLIDLNMKREALEFFVAHPGGPKVMMAMEKVLGLQEGGLKLSWKSLKEYGNLSSASVLFVLKETLKDLPSPGTHGLMAAMGPAFCAELSVLQVC